MGPIAYSLCQKPVVGLVMFVTGACAFPPLFSHAPLALQQAGTVLVKQIEVPVSKPYFVGIHFEFPSAQAVGADEVVGDRHDANCELDYADIPAPQKVGLGRPIALHVRIRDQRTGIVATDKVFNSLCLTSMSGRGFEKSRTAGRIDLAAGSYIVEIRNMAGQAGLEAVKTSVSLVAGYGK